MSAALSLPARDPSPSSVAAARRLLPGLALTAALAAAALALGRFEWLSAHGFSALTLAIVLGIVLGNTLYPRLAHAAGPGVAFSRQSLLRLGVVLYGLRLTVQDIGHVGLAGVAIDAVMLASTFGLAMLVGTKWLKLDPSTSMLIGAGSAICGAAAVMATEPVVKARAEQVTVAVATVVVFGTLGIFLYPELFRAGAAWGFFPHDANGFGIYAGSTIHEVAQVVAAARSVSPQAADSAVIAKMVRVMMLAPFLVLLSAWLGRPGAATGASDSAAQGGKRSVAIPWFAFAFVGMVLFNSLRWLPQPALAVAAEVDTALLAMAMAALGLATHLGAVRSAGVKPLLLAGALFSWLVLGGAAVNRIVPALVG